MQTKKYFSTQIWLEVAKSLARHHWSSVAFCIELKRRRKIYFNEQGTVGQGSLTTVVSDVKISTYSNTFFIAIWRWAIHVYKNSLWVLLKAAMLHC